MNRWLKKKQSGKEGAIGLDLNVKQICCLFIILENLLKSKSPERTDMHFLHLGTGGPLTLSLLLGEFATICLAKISLAATILPRIGLNGTTSRFFTNLRDFLHR